MAFRSVFNGSSRSGLALSKTFTLSANCRNISALLLREESFFPAYGRRCRPPAPIWSGDTPQRLYAVQDFP